MRTLKLSSIRIAFAILGMIPLLNAQQSTGVAQGTVSPQTAVAQKVSVSNAVGERFRNATDQNVFNGGQDRPDNQIGTLTGAISVGVCGVFPRPLWCNGSDIGAWTNAAISLTKCGDVFIPPGTYTQTTSIVKPRCVKLHGASAYSTFLKWTPTHGAMIIMGDGVADAFEAEGALEDLTLLGPGSQTTTCAIYLGGSDGRGGCSPPTSIDPSTNRDDHDNINRVRITKTSSAGAFGVGIQWGVGAWSDTIFESSIAFNGTGIYVPNNLLATGEDLSIISSSITNNVGIGLKIQTGNNINFAIVNSSLDYNGSWGVQNGTARTQNAVSLVNCYIAARSRWLQNYGYMNLTGVYANDGADSGQLGYLIDNEAAFFTVMGGQFFNNGTGAILNPQGIVSTWIAPLATNPGPSGLTPTATYIDRLGDLIPGAIYTNHLNQNTANRLAGTSACSSGTETINFPGRFGSPPVVLLFDETTKGGVSLTMKGTSGFTASCTGASDVFDWIVIGNPN